MFAAGRKQEEPLATRDDSEDWLSVGSSFVEAQGATRRATTSSPSTALQTLSKRRRRDKKSSSKKRRKNDSSSSSESDSSGAESRRRRRHKHQHQYKRLRESDGRPSASALSREHRLEAAAAPAEVQAWIRQQQQQQQADAAAALDGSRLFEFDCAGDRDNRFYGTLYAQDKPLYTLATRRNLLTGAWLADTTSGAARVEAAAKRESEPTHAARYFGARARADEKDARRTRLFLAYSEKRLARQREQRDGGAAAAAAELAFIPLDPVIDGSEELAMRTETANVEQFLVAQSKAFNEALQQQPRDVARWLEYVAFQEQSARLTRSKSAGRSDMVAEKQVAILDKAIEQNPASRALRLARLNLSMLQQQQSSSRRRTALDLDALRQQLEEMIEGDPTNGELWGKLILARQQNFASFSVPSLRELYARVLGVLRKEVGAAVQQELREPSRSSSAPASSGSVQIFDANSLLAASTSAPPPSYASVLATSERANALVRLLLAFHSLACRLEVSAGYSERSIAHLQALLDFNVSSATRNADTTPEQLHSEMLREFASRWSQPHPHFGDNCDSSLSLATAFVPSPDRFLKHVQERVVSSLTSMNPPEALRSPDHQRRLLQLAAGTLYKSRDELGTNDGSRAQEMSSSDKREDSAAATGLTYSNVHGYRIEIDEIDDAGEYERILGELRGTKASIVRQESQAKKKGKQQAIAAKSVARFHDERAEYDQVDKADEYVEWLQQEEVKGSTEWVPLRLTDPQHQELIAESPDRAVLTEEIQPFLFLRSVDHPEALKDVYTDRFDEFDDLRNLLDDVYVNADTLLDPSKVTFARNVLLRFMDVASQAGDRECVRLIKYLWIEFEAHLVRSCEDDRALSLQHARELCQQLLASGAPSDIALMFAYAKLELRAGNLRQVNRICEKTVESLALHSSGDAKMDRSFHCLLFLRARNEIWSGRARDDPTSVQDVDLRKLTALYVLWSCWQRDWESLDSLAKRFRKQPRKLRKHLESVLSSDVRAAAVEKYRVELEVAIQQHSKRASREAGAGLRQGDWLWSVGYCAHNLCLAVYAVAGFHGACSEYQALVREVCSRIGHHESRWLQLCYLEFIQQHQLECAFPIVAPREWRQAVGSAVERLPHDQVLLRLFVDAETANTVSQSLRRHSHRAQQRWQRQFDSPPLVEWLFALLCEFGRLERFAAAALTDPLEYCDPTLPLRSQQQQQETCCLLHKYASNVVGLERVRRLLQDMVENVRTQGHALCWRLYVRFEERMGKVETARRVFYRGLARCPWSKALYLDGVRVVRPYLSDAECKELVDFLSAKELHLRE